jgi:hypothetical protein
VLLCAILATPGSFEIEAAIPSKDGAFLNCDLYDTTEVSAELGWPTIRKLNAELVYKWITALPGWKEGYGKGQAGRALAALAQLVAEQRGGPVTLVWALVGLESLYGSRSGPLAEQILEKSESFLGPRLANKKVFAQMYNFRSRFVHGDLDLPFPYRETADDSPFDSYDSYAYPMDYNEIVATAMLLASLQELIVRGWTSFGFVKTIVGQKEST